MFMGRIISALLLAVLLSPVLLIAQVPLAQAHGESVLTVTPDTVAPGGKITVKGADMGVGEEFKIKLGLIPKLSATD